MQRIVFEEERFEKDEYIKKTIELCRKHGGRIEVDINFCVYANYDNDEHWVGYAYPYDSSWFDSQFKCDSGGKKCQRDQKSHQK